MMDVIWIGNKVANGIDGTRVCCDTNWLNQHYRVYIILCTAKKELQVLLLLLFTNKRLDSELYTWHVTLLFLIDLFLAGLTSVE